MKINDTHKMYYFTKYSERGDFYDIQIESYMELPQNDDTSKFKRMERVRLFYHKDMKAREVGTFEVDFGRHDCMYHFAKNADELVESQTRKVDIYNYKVATLEEYLAMRTKAFEIFQKQTCIDYDTLKPGCEF